MVPVFNDVFRGKRVLVTGHTGFKGSWLCEWLLELGAEVAGFSVNVPSEPSHFRVLRLEERMTSYSGDIRNLAALEAAVRDFAPSVLFHLAAQPIVRSSYDNPKLTFDTNLGGTVNVLEVLRSAVGPLQAAVLITSDKCYENVEWDYGYRETDRLGGQDPYSASKACAEIAFSAYARSFLQRREGPRVSAARAGNVIGGADWAADRIVPDCIRTWTKGECPLIRNPLATRPWQHVLEPLSGYLWLAAGLIQDGERLSGESFNFGPSAENAHSVQALLCEMAKTWPDASWQLAASPAVKKEASLLKLNCDKALNRLSWVSTLTFEESVKMTVEWYREFYSQPAGSAPYTATHIRAYQKLAQKRGRVWARL